MEEMYRKTLPGQWGQLSRKKRQEIHKITEQYMANISFQVFVCARESNMKTMKPRHMKIVTLVRGETV